MVFQDLPIDRGDHISRHDAGFLGRPVGERLGNQCAAGFLEPQSAGESWGQGLELHAKPAARHRSGFQELRNDSLCGLRRNGKTDSDRCPGWRKDDGIDADDTAFDVEGRVIGINTIILSPTGASIGIGFAIPAETAKAVIAQLLETGSVTRGWLGVQFQSLTPALAGALGLKETRGALVAEPFADGPAKKAGIVAGG